MLSHMQRRMSSRQGNHWPAHCAFASLSEFQCSCVVVLTNSSGTYYQRNTSKVFFITEESLPPPHAQVATGIRIRSSACGLWSSGTRIGGSMGLSVHREEDGIPIMRVRFRHQFSCSIFHSLTFCFAVFHLKATRFTTLGYDSWTCHHSYAFKSSYVSSNLSMYDRLTLRGVTTMAVNHHRPTFCAK